MKSIKPGRGPSMMGGVIAIAVAVFGILWTIGASSITGEFSGTSYEGDFMVSGMDIVGGTGFGSGGFGSDPFDTMGAIFPLFGVVFVIIAIALAVYNFKNATSKNRYSEFDIVDGQEEPDPLNERFGGETSEYNSMEGDPFEGSDLFCPYCGTPAEGDYLYCKKCGKRLPRE